MNRKKRTKVSGLRQLVKPIAKPLVLWIFNAAASLRRDALPTPILVYHSLDRSGTAISLDPVLFQRQIDILHSRRYHLLTLREYGRYIEEGRKLPIPSIVLTFDDGFANFFEEGYPALKKYGYRATIFLQTDYIGKLSGFSVDLSLPIMGIKEIKLLQSEGFEFGSHTCSHPALTGIPISRAREEINESKLLLEDLLEREVTSFCYPFGDYDSRIKEIVHEAGYRAAVTLEPGNENGPDNLLSLRRVVIGPTIVPAYFRLILGKYFNMYHHLFQLPLTRIRH